MIDLTIHHKDVTEADGSQRPLFRNLHLRLPDHQHSLAIMGRSGSGKSTLLRVLAGLDTTYDGAYRIEGRDIGRDPNELAGLRNTTVALVTQVPLLLGDHTVLDNLLVGLRRGTTHRDRARELLDQTGVAHLAAKKASHISGGEAQRVTLARALMRRPAILLADEPTGALDEGTENEILTLFGHLADTGTTIITATHSHHVAAACQQTLTIHDLALVAA